MTEGLQANWDAERDEDELPPLNISWQVEPGGGMNRLSEDVLAWAKRKGFSHPYGYDDTVMLLSRLALVHSEVSEMVEAARKPEVDVDNFREEMADTFIRLFHLCGALGIDIEAEIAKKMEVNETRPHMHGKRT